MGVYTSRIALHTETIVCDSNRPSDGPFANFILKSPFFDGSIVTNLRTFIVERDTFLGVILPNNMQSMLLFRKTYKNARSKAPIRCVRYKRKIDRWPFQGLFFPIGEIGLGVQDEKSGAIIHSLRTGCLQSGQMVRVYVMKNTGPARLLAAAQAMHWASVHEDNPAMVDMFEDMREKERSDQVDPVPYVGTLKVLYMDASHQYLRRGPSGPVGPEEMLFEQGCEFRISSLNARDMFLWLILETTDRKIFMSRQIRVYSEMFFRNKFGVHASSEMENAELALHHVEEQGGDTSGSMEPALKEIKKVASNRSPEKDTITEDMKVDALRGNPTSAEKQEESQKVTPEQLQSAAVGGSSSASQSRDAPEPTI